MRLTCLVTAALALAGAGAADACCFLKCLGKSHTTTAAPAGLAAPVPRMDLTIISIGGYRPSNGNINYDLDWQKDITVIVHGPLPCDPNVMLVITEQFGGITGTAEPEGDHCKYTFIIKAKTLKPKTLYSARATNGDGSSVSTPVTFKTTPP